MVLAVVVPMSRKSRDMGHPPQQSDGVRDLGHPTAELPNRTFQLRAIPLVFRDVDVSASDESSHVNGGLHHSIEGWCVSMLIAHASRSATLLRNGRFAFYYL